MNSYKQQRNMKKSLHLPQELIIQILLRLPVKSIVRFKCVCKSWLLLISDPQFAKSQFELAAARTNRLVFIATTAPAETRSIDLDASLNDDSASAALELKSFMFRRSYFHHRIVGSCRGFLLLEYGPDSYVWNPSTGVLRHIYWSPIASDPDIEFFTYLYGFGYDPSTDDYLLVVASYDPTSADCLTHFEFFSLRANKWKEIEGAPLPYMNASEYARDGSPVNGAIHWFALRHDISGNVIVAFDLKERSLSEVPLPPEDFYYEPTYCDLWVFEGFLSLWVMGNDVVDIWVMKEYNVESSWTKILVLSTNDIPTQLFFPICSTKTGDIVGIDGRSGLVKYDDKGQLLEYRSYGDHPHGSQVAMYTESLLSLPGNIDQCEEDNWHLFFYGYMDIENEPNTLQCGT